jgi:hypothetical protein
MPEHNTPAFYFCVQSVAGIFSPTEPVAAAAAKNDNNKYNPNARVVSKSS